jgi:hypothetical protein
VALVAKANLMVEEAVRKASNTAAREVWATARDQLMDVYNFIDVAGRCIGHIYSSVMFSCATRSSTSSLPQWVREDLSAVEALHEALRTYAGVHGWEDGRRPPLRAILLKHLQTTKEQEAGHGG